MKHICSHCQYVNTHANQFCNYCGKALNGQALVPYQEKPMVVSRRRLPAIPTPVKRAAAMGVVSLLANAGIRLLRHRLTHGTLLPPRTTSIVPTTSPSPKYRLLFAQRIVERWQAGHLQERTIEQVVATPDESSNY